MLLRYRCAAGDRLLLVNLGTDLHLDVAPEPLLAPPLRRATGGRSGPARTRATAVEGPSAVETDDGFRLPGHAAVVLVPEAPASARSERPPRPQPDRPTGAHRLAARRRQPRRWSAASGSSPTASAATPAAPSAACSPGATTACSVAALPAPAGRTTMLNQLGRDAAPRRRHRPCARRPRAGRRTASAPRGAGRVPPRQRPARVAVRAGRRDAGEANRGHAPREHHADRLPAARGVGTRDAGARTGGRFSRP